jgi:hypothetical protein
MIYVLYFSDGGTPKTGLSPSITIYKKVADGSDVASPPAVSEIGGGFYKFTATPSEALVARIDGGSTLADAYRYKVMQITPHDADLDAAVSTRAPETGGNVAAIKAKTDNLPASPAAVGSAMTLTSAYDAAKTAAPESGGNIAAIKAKTDNLPASPAATGDIPSASSIATTVWANATRTLTSFGTLVTDVWGNATRSLTDKAGFSISGTKQTLDALQDLSQAQAQTAATAALNAYDPPTKAELDSAVAPLAKESGGNLAAVKAKTDNLPASPANEANVETHVAAALAAYDPPTQAELAAAVAPLALEAGIEAHVLAVLNSYDPPTRAEAAGDKDAVLAAIAGLNDITVGELLAGDISDNLNFPANSLADLVRKLFWVVCNRMVITDASGVFTAYKSGGVTPAATGTITDNGVTTERSEPTWP